MTGMRASHPRADSNIWDDPDSWGHDNAMNDIAVSKHFNTSPNNLPLQVNRFIGREREMSAVRGLLMTTRLLTLAGAGGSGKTRLALQVATDLLEEFEHAVWWVELADLSDAGGGVDVNDLLLFLQHFEAGC